jgi:hypothetical protein
MTPIFPDHFEYFQHLAEIPLQAHQRGGLAEEVGFEPTVPRCGTPVFETGPINHSGTPPIVGQAEKPDLRGVQSTKFTPFLEEFCEDFPARPGEDPRGERDPVIEPRVVDNLI